MNPSAIGHRRIAVMFAKSCKHLFRNTIARGVKLTNEGIATPRGMTLIIINSLHSTYYLQRVKIHNFPKLGLFSLKSEIIAQYINKNDRF